MSLRWKIALAVALVAAAATLVVGIAGYRSTRDRLYDEIDRSLVVVDEPRPGAPFDEAARPIGRPSLYEEQWLGPRGAVVHTTFVQPVEPSPAAATVIGRRNRSVVETLSVDGTRYRMRTAGLAEGARQTARSLAETDRVLSSLRNRTILVVLTATGFAALLGSLIAGRVTASLRRLTAAADLVRSTGRLDIDVASSGSDEVSRLGASFGAMLDALARSRAEQQRLVEDAGHELKTPLTSIRTNLDVLRRHPELDAGARAQVVGDLHAEVEEMVDLVEEVVAVAGGVAPDEPVTAFSLGDVVADVVDRYQRRADRRIDVDLDDSPVLAQAAAVQRAVSNLLDNAVKFDTSDGPIMVTVRSGRVDVLDRGPGISDSDRDLVFERFHRGAEARTLPGSGLGLSIVREVVERNGGTTHASGRQGGGAAVGFTLPVTGSG